MHGDVCITLRALTLTLVFLLFFHNIDLLIFIIITFPNLTQLSHITEPCSCDTKLKIKLLCDQLQFVLRFRIGFEFFQKGILFLYWDYRMLLPLVMMIW